MAKTRLILLNVGNNYKKENLVITYLLVEFLTSRFKKIINGLGVLSTL